MTDEELAAIKSRVVRFTPAGDLRTMSPDLGAMTFDARTLLAEVEQLRAVIDEAIIAFEGEVSCADPTIARMYAVLGRQGED